jgi:hypothetical protein
VNIELLESLHSPKTGQRLVLSDTVDLDGAVQPATLVTEDMHLVFPGHFCAS